MSDPTNVSINSKTIEQLAVLGIDAPNGKLAPEVLFGNQIFESPKSILILLQIERLKIKSQLII